MNYQYRYDRGCRALVESSRSGSGTLITQGSHALDILLSAAGGRPLRAWGVVARRRFTGIEVEDLAMGCVEMDTGCLLSVTSTAAATPERAVTLEVYGSRATAVWTGPSRSRLRVYGSRTSRRLPPGRGQHAHARPVRGVHPMARDLEAFRRWVAFGEEPLTTAESTLPVLAVVTSIYAAARAGRTFRIPPFPAPGG